MRTRAFLLCAISLACASLAPAAAVERTVTGARVSESIPPIPAGLGERLRRYGNTRGAVFSGWLADGSGMLVSTRFGNTTQVHLVSSPLGARSQLTFFDEPIASVASHPQRNGFVFGKDSGGSERQQLYWFDLDTREMRLLTDGHSRNGHPLFSPDGKSLAHSSTGRNGRDADIWLLDLDTGERRIVLGEGGEWEPAEFSPGGQRLLARQRRSLEESPPVSVDLASGEIRRIHDPARRIGFDAFVYAPHGKGAYYIASGGGEFRSLWYRGFAGDRDRKLSGHIDWDITEFALSRDGRRLAFIANEDGFGRLHVLDTATRREIALPAMPEGVAAMPDFSADGERIAFTLNSPVSPSDVWVLDLRTQRVERWTESEVGGLDPRRFVMPELVRFPTFDRAGSRPRQVPALYYRPPPRADGAPHPVVIDIHGGPEAQARPTFNAGIQFLVGELGIAVLLPNVRGSSGYGRRWLDLDNGERREDAVRDVGALLDWIATRPELDAGRVGVSGSSYGGYMTLASMIAHGERLRAGIDVVGISNFVTFLANTGDYRRDRRRVEYGDERDPRMRRTLERISPLGAAQRIRKPLFVAHGANDPRVPASEAEQIVRSVRANGGEVWYLLFGDEGHGFEKKANADHFRAASMLFWQRHLLGIDADGTD